MSSPLQRNLQLTLPLVLVFTVVGYVASIPIGFYLDARATSWQFNFRSPSDLSIETERLDNLRRFHIAVALGGAVLGAVIAQTTFIAREIIRENERGNDN